MTLKKIVFSLIPILIIISITEIYLLLKKPNFTQLDKHLGWRLKSNFNHIYTQKNLKGTQYKVNFSTNEYGLRHFITNQNEIENVKIFVIGDSFTSDPYASNDLMWYSEIAKKISKDFNKNVLVHSMGAGGYSNFQQLLQLRELKKTGYNFENITFFIFQYCNNDLQNNSISIEKKLKNYNQYSRRPYLINNQIFYDDTLLLKILRIPFIGESRILNKIFFLLSKVSMHNLEIQKQDYEKSIQITKNIINLIQKELNKKTLMINCNINNNWPFNFIDDIASENNFYYLNYPKNIKTDENNFFEDGSHLSEVGNKFLGSYLYDEIVNNDLLEYLIN